MERKPKIRIEHQIVEKTDFIMPIFFLMLNLGFFIMITYLAGITLYTETNSEVFTIGILALSWFVWIWGLVRNKVWRPEKIKTIEHVVIGAEEEKKIKRKSIFSLFRRKK
jgi:hypothetical protein